jgi:putative membrane protein
MTTEILLRYVHFISIFFIVGSLFTEFVLLKREMSRHELARLSQIDAVYGLAAIALLAAGLTLWLGSIGKPAEFYTRNPIFLIKLGLFTVVGLLSIYPTVYFIKNRKGDAAEVLSIPAAIIWMLRLELMLIFIIPLLAGLMAKGVGLSE